MDTTEKKQVFAVTVNGQAETHNNGQARRVTPTALKVKPENIPAELKAKHTWILWRYEWNEKKEDFDKIPYNPHGLDEHNPWRAKSNDLLTGGSFDLAYSLYLRFACQPDGPDGIGFMNDPSFDIVGMDSDDVKDYPERFKAFELWSEGTYAEWSPSGNGVRAFGRGSLPEDRGRKNDEIEIYNKGRFLTVTGHVLDGHPLALDCIQQSVDDILDTHFAEPDPPPVKGPRPAVRLGIGTDETIVDKCRTAKNSAKFAALWSGDEAAVKPFVKAKSDGGPDWSAADLGLASILAFYTQDPDQLERLMAASGLVQRDDRLAKWKSSRPVHGTYGRMTINTALAGLKDVYKWLDVTELETKADQVCGEAPSKGRPAASDNGDGGHDQDRHPEPDTTTADLEKYKTDPRTAYLWKDNHARISDQDRERRIKSIEDVWQLIPKTGFFPEYIKYALPATDGPVLFHMSAALALASHLINRKIWKKSGNKKLCPQVWAGNLGKSTVSRKSESGQQIVPIIANDPDYCQTILASTAFSMEGIYAQLGTTLEKAGKIKEQTELMKEQDAANAVAGIEYTGGVGMFHIDEMGSWLGALNASYNGGGLKIVTEWFGWPRDEFTKITKSGVQHIYKPFVSILASSTVDWLNSNLHESDLMGGFIPRWLFFYARESDYKLPLQDTSSPTQFVVLNKEIAIIKSRRGEYTLSPEAIGLYEDWFKTFGNGVDERLVSWVGRLITYSLKIAMLFQASTSDDPVIDGTNMALATKLIDRVLFDLKELVAHDLAFGLDENLNRKVVQALKSAHGPLRRRSILNKTKLKKAVVEPILEYLAEIQQITVTKYSANGQDVLDYEWVKGV
jgi:hypothetical protein